MTCLLALSLTGCYEYRGPYTTADVEEGLAGKYPDETIHIRHSGLQTWECWFEELPDAVFHVWVGQGGGDPVPMLYWFPMKPRCSRPIIKSNIKRRAAV